jgi:cell division protein ZapA
MKTIHVDILGQRYAVRSELDPAYIGQIATYLDEKMRQAAAELATADPLRVAVLAALNVADELHRARLEASGSHDQLLARTREIEAMVDSVLSDARTRLAINE